MACHIMRTLNNALFQKLHILGDGQNSGFRYELTHWAFHIRMSEQCWPEEERGNEDVADQWEQLYEYIDTFMSSKAFQGWSYFPKVHYAARFGLLGTLQRLADAGEDLNALKDGCNLLHMVCLGEGDYISSREHGGDTSQPSSRRSKRHKTTIHTSDHTSSVGPGSRQSHNQSCSNAAQPWSRARCFGQHG
ncbi:hypothetical protein IWX90DRAFT_430434 [Phyllosticta citrichinensis]|uniref:Transposase n=1 Tax=Phyllosticta citrichinensis TaxID=1130410 RepID=A0ABR1XWI3_9PEZI